MNRLLIIFCFLIFSSLTEHKYYVSTSLFNFTENTIIEKLNVYGYSINLGNQFGIFFSILCVMLFVNAFNVISEHFLVAKFLG